MQRPANLKPGALRRLRLRVCHHPSSHLSFHSMIVSSVSMPFLMLRSYRCSNTAALKFSGQQMLVAMLHSPLGQH